MNHTIYEHLTHYPTGKILPVYSPLIVDIQAYNTPADKITYGHMREFRVELKVSTVANVSEELLRDAANAEAIIRAEGFEQIKHHLYKDCKRYFHNLELAIHKNDKSSIHFYLREFENEVLGCN